MAVSDIGLRSLSTDLGGETFGTGYNIIFSLIQYSYACPTDAVSVGFAYHGIKINVKYTFDYLMFTIIDSTCAAQRT